MGDFETTVYKGQVHTEVWASAVVEFHTEDVEIHHSISETFEYLKNINDNVCIYYHNLKFDGAFWLSYLLTELKYTQAYDLINDGKGEDPFCVKWLHDKDMPNNSFKYSISNMGQWYNIIIKTNNKFIEIRDSLKLLPFSVKRIGNEIFRNCISLEEVKLSQSINEISKKAFEGCKSLKHIEIPEGVTKICANAFSMCTSLETITLPQSLIAKQAFYGCSSLKSVILPKSLIHIGADVFMGCKELKNISIPIGVEIIKSSTFWGCKSLSSIALHDKIKTIGKRAFYNCLSLESIVIPKSVLHISDEAFFCCKNLSNVDFISKDLCIGSRVFYSTNWYTDVKNQLFCRELLAKQN